MITESRPCSSILFSRLFHGSGRHGKITGVCARSAHLQNTASPKFSPILVLYTTRNGCADLHDKDS